MSSYEVALQRDAAGFVETPRLCWRPAGGGEWLPREDMPEWLRDFLVLGRRVRWADYLDLARPYLTGLIENGRQAEMTLEVTSSGARGG